MSINLDFDKEKQVVKFLEQAKKKLAQYEAYSLRDGHINAFEEYTLDKLRELIQKIEEKIANSKSLAFDFGPETSYLNTSKSLKVNLVKSYQKSESVPMQIQQNFQEINTHFSWLSDMNYTEQYNSIDEKKTPSLQHPQPLRASIHVAKMVRRRYRGGRYLFEQNIQTYCFNQ